MFCTCHPSPWVFFAFSFFSAHLGLICWMTTPPTLSTPLRALVASSLTFFLFPTNFGPVAASLTAGFSRRSPGCLIPKVPSLLPPVCPTQSLPLLYRLYLIRSLVRSRPPRQFRHRCFPAPAFCFALGPLRPSMHVLSPLLLSTFPPHFYFLHDD